MFRTAAVLLLMLVAPLQAATYGEAVPAGDATPLAQALAEFDGDDEAAAPAAALYRGRIVEVCQKKGCWAMLEDDGRAARLMMQDHAFSIPSGYRGEARLIGKLQRVELSEQAAQHLAEDAGRNEPVASIEYRIDTLGIELVEEAPHAH